MKLKEYKLRDLMPKSIDDIICTHRDEGALRVLNDFEIYNLGKIDSVASIKARAKDGEIDNWYIIRLDLFTSGRDITFMVGNRNGYVFNTSGVVAIDVDAGVVRTQNSTYLLGERGIGELDRDQDLDLRLHICHYLHTCSLSGHSIGQIFGVLNVGYK